MGSTIFFKNKPAIISTSTICGPKEGQGNLGEYVETRLNDDTYGEDTYEKAECKMLSHVIENSVKNANLSFKDVNCLISGDLLNQIIFMSSPKIECSTSNGTKNLFTKNTDLL